MARDQGACRPAVGPRPFGSPVGPIARPAAARPEGRVAGLGRLCAGRPRTGAIAWHAGAQGVRPALLSAAAREHRRAARGPPGHRAARAQRQAHQPGRRMAARQHPPRGGADARGARWPAAPLLSRPASARQWAAGRLASRVCTGLGLRDARRRRLHTGPAGGLLAGLSVCAHADPGRAVGPAHHDARGTGGEPAPPGRARGHRRIRTRGRTHLVRWPGRPD